MKASISKGTVLTGILFAFGAVGCDLSNIPIDVAPAETQLVVSSVVGPGDILLVTVSRSFSALSATDADSLEADFLERLLVDSALVTLARGGEVDTMLSLPDVPGVYATELRTPEELEPLEISVTDPRNGDTVSATTEYMRSVSIDSASVSEELSATGEPTTILHYRFADLPGESYYAVYAYSSSRDLDPDSLAGSSLDGQVDVFHQNLIADRALAGSIVENTVRIPFFSVEESVVLSIGHISEGYYRFLQARRRTGGIVSSLANEPVNHPTNVEGGLGYFSAHRPTAIIVDAAE